MSEQFDDNSGALLKRKEQPRSAFISGNGDSGNGSAQGGQSGPNPRPAIDAWTVLDVLARRWYWMLLGGVLAAGLFFVLGTRVVQPKFTATAKLLRYETHISEFFRSAPMSGETFSGLIRSPDLFRRVSDLAVTKYGIAPIAPERFVKMVKVEAEPDSDLVKLSLAANQPETAVNLLNLYAEQAVRFTLDMQRQQSAKLANDYLKKQVAQMDEDITVLHQQFRNMPAIPGVTNKLAEIGGNLSALSTNMAAAPRTSFMLSEQTRRLQAAVGELHDLLAKFTDLHPTVQAKKEEIASLQAGVDSTLKANPGLTAQAMSAPASRPGETTPFNPELDIVRTKLLSLEQGRVELANRQREAQLMADDPPGIVRILVPGTLKTVESNMRWVKISAVGIFGGLLGVFASLLLVLLVEFVDGRLKTVDDLRRVTRLPVLTSLGDLREMSPEDRSQWAFRTWTLLQGRLSPSANHGLVCGITSSTPGEGRSTWISLLAEAASMSGFRVLTIATRPSPTHLATDQQFSEARPAEDRDMTNTPSQALTTSVLSSPMQVTEKLTGPNSEPMVHIPLPGWVWNLERRKQWREALTHWREIENLVILVELPPASVAESVLLGSNLPNMVWLTSSGKAQAGETKAQLETLRNARCNLVGAVLNREAGTPLRSRFPRWMSALILFAGFYLAATPLTAPAAEGSAPGSESSPAATQPAPAPAVPSFSIVNPSQRAEWQKRLTLGPGDVLTLGLYGAPELARADVAIGPDGRLSYLEAQDVPATGLTIDELRDRLNQELGRFRRAPRVMITPGAFRSKRYYMLGKVMTRGVYILDRPLTVLEAIARAHGLENGLVDRNVVDLADFQRSFLARNGKRYPVSFESLFQQGDLSQNMAIEPGDYIYIAGGNVNQVYVVGEVRLPGPVTLSPKLTIIGAIAARGGYSERAYKTRVLVVRGSLDKPEAIPVDTHAVLDGRGLDFELKPRDIIYVNSRPLIRLEEGADMAATAFIQALISEWVGVDIVQPYKQ